MHIAHPSIRHDERGVALPLALLGLVSVSLLVTTALVTSSTEYAISAAHEDATSALYTAEGGLQAYVGQEGTVLQTAAGQPAFTYDPPGAGQPVTLSVVHLGSHTRADLSIVRLFSIQSSSQTGGGRSVAAVATQIIPPPVALSTNITSALTIGGDLHVNGNAFSVSGRTTDAACGPGVEAVRKADSVEVTVNNSSMLDRFTGTDDAGNDVSGDAAITSTTLTAAQLAQDVLGGKSLEELISSLPAANKWGPRYSPPGGTVRTFDGTVDAAEAVAVVDADGGTVDLLGGTGLLIVVNGNMRMTGNARFDGIIIVEGAFTLSGTPDVVGALISLSYSASSEIDLEDDDNAIGQGDVVVQYDRCQIDDAANKFGQLTQAGLTPTVQPTTSWLEVVR